MTYIPTKPSLEEVERRALVYEKAVRDDAREQATKEKALADIAAVFQFSANGSTPKMHRIGYAGLQFPIYRWWRKEMAPVPCEDILNKLHRGYCMLYGTGPRNRASMFLFLQDLFRQHPESEYKKWS